MNFTLGELKDYWNKPSSFEMFKFFMIMSVLEDIAHHPWLAVFNAVLALITVIISMFE